MTLINSNKSYKQPIIQNQQVPIVIHKDLTALNMSTPYSQNKNTDASYIDQEERSKPFRIRYLTPSKYSNSDTKDIIKKLNDMERTISKIRKKHKSQAKLNYDSNYSNYYFNKKMLPPIRSSANYNPVPNSDTIIPNQTKKLNLSSNNPIHINDYLQNYYKKQELMNELGIHNSKMHLPTDQKLDDDMDFIIPIAQKPIPKKSTTAGRLAALIRGIGLLIKLKTYTLSLKSLSMKTMKIDFSMQHKIVQELALSWVMNILRPLFHSVK